MKRIQINSTVEDRVPYHQIKIIQGDLKDLHQDDILKFEKNVLENGFVDPIDVWVDEAGHYGEAGALCSLGGTQRLRLLQYVEQKGYAVPAVPVNRIQAKTYKEANKILLSLASTYGKITPGGLAEFAHNAGLDFGELKDGFSLPDIDLGEVEKEFSQDHTDKEEKEDDVPEPPKDPVSKLGDLYELGEHRLLCGDSKDKATVEKLMGGAKADMVFTDPPYGVSYTGGVIRGNKINTDNKRVMLKNDDVDMYSKWLSVLGEFIDDGAIYIFYATRYSLNIFKPLEENGFDLHAVIAWVKINTGYADMNSHYKNKYEPCVYAKKKGQSLNFVGPTTECTVWEIKKDRDNTLHPTQKPVDIPERAIANSSKQGGRVLDCFGGSGSTLIACEKTKRKCFMMELDPHYIDVIVSRWCKYTGNTKIKKNGKPIEWKLNETPA